MTNETTNDIIEKQLFEDLDSSITLDDGAFDESLIENYLKEDVLVVPEEAKIAYKEKGYDLQWKRILDPLTKEYDVGYIQVIERQGYRFLKRSEVPGLGNALNSFFGDKLTDDFGMFTVGDQALTALPIKLQMAKRRAKHDKTRARGESIMKDLRKNDVAPDSNSGEVYDIRRTQPQGREIDLGE